MIALLQARFFNPKTISKNVAGKSILSWHFLAEVRKGYYEVGGFAISYAVKMQNRPSFLGNV